jgi:putative dehydrogenase
LNLKDIKMHTIGFVGLGAMGAAMAQQLVSKQFKVVGFDLNTAAVQALAANGGHAAGSAAEAASGADALIVMVVNADQAEAVLFDGGALDALSNGAPVIVCSTCAPERAEAMAKRCETAGHPYVDAPVSGGMVGAEAGTLTIMAAAPKPAFAATEGVLKAMGSNTYFIGEKVGQGSAMKTVNQLMAGVHIAVAAEAIAFAERAGIEPALALEILSGSAASSWMLQNRGPEMVEQTGKVTSAVDIFVKDLGIVLDAGRSMRMGLPLAATAHQNFLNASGAGFGKQDDSQVVKVYRKLKEG